MLFIDCSSLGMFYYTIGNLSPKLRSRLSSIQLLAVVRAKLVTKYKMPVILQPIVEDLKKLVSIMIKYTCLIVLVRRKMF